MRDPLLAHWLLPPRSNPSQPGALPSFPHQERQQGGQKPQPSFFLLLKIQTPSFSCCHQIEDSLCSFSGFWPITLAKKILAFQGRNTGGFFSPPTPNLKKKKKRSVSEVLIFLLFLSSIRLDFMTGNTLPFSPSLPTVLSPLCRGSFYSGLKRPTN